MKAKLKIKQLKLDELKAADKFLLSFPLKPELYYELWEKFVPLPLIMINQQNEILFGIDLYHFLQLKNAVEVDVIQMDIFDKGALVLNYNLKEKFTGLNLYEKLVFIKKRTASAADKDILLAEVSGIYRETGLDIAVNRELLEKLDLLLSTVFRDGLINEHINLKTGLRLCDFLQEDSEVLLDLFGRIPFSSSHQLKILEMAEEILFRDKCTMGAVFERLDIERYMDMEKPQKKIIDELFKYRNPVYMEAEKKWQAEIKALNLPDYINVSHYPFFEKKQLELTIHLQDAGGLKKLIEKIKD